jgi:hypothetical protein
MTNEMSPETFTEQIQDVHEAASALLDELPVDGVDEIDWGVARRELDPDELRVLRYVSSIEGYLSTATAALGSAEKQSLLILEHVRETDLLERLRDDED